MNCKGISVTVGTNAVPAYACLGEILKDSDQTSAGLGNGWSIHLANGGCLDANNKPVMVTDWAAASEGNQGACASDSTGLPSGFSTSCFDYVADPDGDGPQVSTSFTCKWTQGQFPDTAGAPNLAGSIAAGNHVGPSEVTIAKDDPCGDQADGVGAGLTLDEAQCYAEHYFQNRDSFNETCAPSPRFNHAASTVEEFYKVDYRAKPKAQFLMDILTYDASGSLGTLDTVERESFTLPSGSDSNVTCEVARKIVFNLRKTGDNKAVVDIRFSGYMASTSAACQSVAKTALANIEYNKTVVDQNLKRRAIQNGDLEYVLSPQAMIMNMTRQ